MVTFSLVNNTFLEYIPLGIVRDAAKIGFFEMAADLNLGVIYMTAGAYAYTGYTGQGGFAIR